MPHTLAWHSQTANWFFQPGPDGAPVTRELAMERLKSHIMTSAGRYKGKVISWDVVNEAIEDKGDGQTEALRKSSQWLQKIGPDFITLAFKWAHEADPGAELYYNDYSIDQGASTNSGKHVSSMALLKRLIADGAPIHGVGIQGHWHLDTNIADVEKAIENYESLGLKITISEMDVTATGTNSGALRAATPMSAPSPLKTTRSRRRSTPSSSTSSTVTPNPSPASPSGASATSVPGAPTRNPSFLTPSSSPKPPTRLSWISGLANNLFPINPNPSPTPGEGFLVFRGVIKISVEEFQKGLPVFGGFARDMSFNK